VVIADQLDVRLMENGVEDVRVGGADDPEGVFDTLLLEE
jgi:hypothetical protein